MYKYRECVTHVRDPQHSICLGNTYLKFNTLVGLSGSGIDSQIHLPHTHVPRPEHSRPSVDFEG